MHGVGIVSENEVGFVKIKMDLRCTVPEIFKDIQKKS